MSRSYERKTRHTGTHAVPAPQDQWYALHVLSGKERRVVENIDRLIKEEEMGSIIFGTLVPTEKVEDVRNGKKYVIERKLFPGYVYINMGLRRPDNTLDNDAWYRIQAVDGVISFACGRNKEPLPMPKKNVEALFSEIARRQEVARPKVSFNVKDEVMVLDGAFKDQRGVVEEIDPEHGKLRVGVSIFGRSTPVDLDYSQVALVPEDERGQSESPSFS